MSGIGSRVDLGSDARNRFHCGSGQWFWESDLVWFWAVVLGIGSGAVLGIGSDV